MILLTNAFERAVAKKTGVPIKTTKKVLRAIPFVVLESFEKGYKRVLIRNFVKLYVIEKEGRLYNGIYSMGAHFLKKRNVLKIRFSEGFLEYFRKNIRYAKKKYNDKGENNK